MYDVDSLIARVLREMIYALVRVDGALGAWGGVGWVGWGTAP